MFYTVYKITNLINNKIYIGVHKTSNINDDYMGSGVILKKAQEKYGIENFQKEILEVFDNPEDMFNMESKLVNEDFVKDTETYNIKLGGFGGWSHLNDGSQEHIERTKRGMKKAKENGFLEKAMLANAWLYENDPIWLKNKVDKFKISITKYYETHCGIFKGKHHTEETKEKMRKAHKGKQKGEKNSQFNTMWIYSLEEKKNKKIPKGSQIPEGWLKGRKMKF